MLIIALGVFNEHLLCVRHFSFTVLFIPHNTTILSIFRWRRELRNKRLVHVTQLVNGRAGTKARVLSPRLVNPSLSTSIL